MYNVYGKPNCPNCQKTRFLLAMHDIQYNYYDVFENESDMLYVLAHGFKALPAIFDDNIKIGGYNELLKHLNEIAVES